MISPSALPDFARSTAPSRSAPVPRDGSADSFQSIFAQAATAPETASAPTVSDNGSTGNSEAASDQGPGGTQAAPVDKGESAGNGQPLSHGGPASVPAANATLNSSKLALTPALAKTPDSVKTPAVSLTVSGRANLALAGPSPATTTVDKVEKKVNQPGNAPRSEAGGGATTSGGPLAAGASAAMPPGALRSHASAPAVTAERAPAVQADGRSPVPAVALGGLSGAAFALHVTQVQKQSDRASSTAAAQAADQLPVQPGAAAPDTTDAADTGAPNLASLTACFSDSTGLTAGGTALVAGSSARSRQVSALGASLAPAGTAGWFGPSATPTLWNAEAKSAASVTAAAPPAEIEAEDPAAAAQPLHMLQLQLGGTGNQRVDLRLVERAGGLAVGVRASDSELTRGLQDNLPELSARLAAEHYQTEAWVPAASQTPATAAPASSEHQPEQRGGAFSQGGSSSSGGEGKRQQGRQQDQPPAWSRAPAPPGGASVPASTSVQRSTPT